MEEFIKYKGHMCKQDYCPTCNKNKGLVRKARLGKDCHSCNSKKMAIIGATHNGKQNEVITSNRIIRSKQVIIISEKTKEKISVSNKKSWHQKHGPSVPEDHRKCRTAFSKLLSRYVRERSLSPRSEKSKFDCLGFSPKELFDHLESRFHSNPRTGEVMSWNNYGSWHIDHKTPDSWFSYSSFYDKGFKDSWSLSNLQPKWEFDNLSKGNRFKD